MPPTREQRKNRYRKRIAQIRRGQAERPKLTAVGKQGKVREGWERGKDGWKRKKSGGSGQMPKRGGKQVVGINESKKSDVDENRVTVTDKDREKWKANFQGSGRPAREEGESRVENEAKGDDTRTDRAARRQKLFRRTKGDDYKRKIVEQYAQRSGTEGKKILRGQRQHRDLVGSREDARNTLERVRSKARESEEPETHRERLEKAKAQLGEKKEQRAKLGERMGGFRKFKQRKGAKAVASVRANRADRREAQRQDRQQEREKRERQRTR